jgi:enoyl-CoA hydratase
VSNDFVNTELIGGTFVVSINRPEVRNAVNRDCADTLAQAFREFERNERAKVAVLAGEGGTFCAGADLSAIGSGTMNRFHADGDGPMGPTRMLLAKPVIAAIDGYAVAGGLELALWCDLRVMEIDAILGVFCRRFGVPLVDGGTVRLPRIVGVGRALDLILTGRAVGAAEALSMGLVSRVVESGTARVSAIALAEEIAAFPEVCMRGDRLSTYEGLSLTEAEALRIEFDHGTVSMNADMLSGVENFKTGTGRHGRFE